MFFFLVRVKKTGPQDRKKEKETRRKGKRERERKSLQQGAPYKRRQQMMPKKQLSNLVSEVSIPCEDSLYQMQESGTM